MGLIRRLCVKLLSDEFNALRNVISEQENDIISLMTKNKIFETKNGELECKIAEYERHCIIPKSLSLLVIDNIIDPKLFKECQLNWHRRVKRALTLNVSKLFVNILYEKVTDEAMKVSIPEFGITLEVRCELKNNTYNLFGVVTEVNVYHWNWSRSGMTTISDLDFFMILNFLKAQRNVIIDGF